MIKLYLIISILLINTSVRSQERRVSITIDDLPGTDDSYEYIMNGLISFLSDNKIPTIGFVNEGKLYEDGKIKKERVHLLQDWVAKDLDLGNHTFSHVFINETDVSAYKTDIIKGEKVIRSLMEAEQKELKYFRHPQLRTGPTDTYRLALESFLEEQSYITAPVTIDNEEYIYAFCYKNADEDLRVPIAQDYLRYMEEVIIYYENLSLDYLGYELPQILLIHANELNADHIDKLANILKNRNYEFISLEEALSDITYQLPTGTHQRGLSWIHRWMIENGLIPPIPPKISDFILNIYQDYSSR